MKEKNTGNEKLMKRLIFTVAVAFLAIILTAVGTSVSTKKLNNINKETTPFNEPGTLLAEVPKTDVPDERDFVNNTEDLTEGENPEQYTEKMKEETTAESTTAAPVNSSFALPLTGEVTKEFSGKAVLYSETMNDWRVHTGTDFKGNEGDKVLSVGNGTVSKVYADSNWGYVIEVDYGSFTGRYCGISQDGAVGIETKVKQGDVIGVLTSIPIESKDGIHLHFEAVKKGSRVDPFDFFANEN